MPITVSITDQCSVGNKTERWGVFDLGSYVAGGVPFTSSKFGFQAIEDIIFPSVVTNSSGANPITLSVCWSGAKRFIAYQPGAAGEVANGTALNDYFCHFRARGVV